MREAAAYHFVHRNLCVVVTGTLLDESLKRVPVSNPELAQAASLFDLILGRWFHKLHQDAGTKPVGHSKIQLLKQDYPWVDVHETVGNSRRTLCCVVSSFALLGSEE